ncbi:aminoglycoside phosphotransferase family protein [Armatimonas sp.]|uniref:aminoglycoside phosphotransferase family protein n=1 Tax=Armatimonas sp. TaxID=1872638 RepID=UPI00286A25FB|nr:aminoglycoside phosphotransferase family protein [Armatimonas sp.]
MTIELLTGGQANSVFAATFPSGERAVLRLHSRTDGFAGTVHTIARLAALGLPVPEVLASGQARDFSWLILSWTPGVELRWALAGMTPEQQTRVAEQIVALQRRVSTLPQGSGFGFVPPGTPSTHATWWSLLQTHPRLDEAPDDLKAYLQTVPPTCFLDDITGKNVLIENGELTGLIDLDCVCYGDLLYWLALTHVGLVCDTATELYPLELIRLWNPDPLECRVLAFYSALMADDFLSWFATNESPEWQQRMRAARERWFQAACLTHS